MTNLQLLHLSFDGPIPRELIDAAIVADRASRASEPEGPPAAYVKVKRWKPAGIVDRMATVMMGFAAGRPCYRTDLAQAGFSTKEIDRYGEDARALAARRLADNPTAPRPIEIPVTALLALAAAIRKAQAQRKGHAA